MVETHGFHGTMIGRRPITGVSGFSIWAQAVAHPARPAALRGAEAGRYVNTSRIQGRDGPADLRGRGGGPTTGRVLVHFSEIGSPGCRQHIGRCRRRWGSRRGVSLGLHSP